MLGKVVGEETRLSTEGEIVKVVWDELPGHYENVELDKFVVMPNHIHGIVWITEDEKQAKVGARHASPLQKPRGFKPGALGSIVASFKSASTCKINILHVTPGAPFWQRGYYDHIIRNDKDLFEHRKYIINNPLKWHLDEYFRELEIIQV